MSLYLYSETIVGQIHHTHIHTHTELNQEADLIAGLLREGRLHVEFRWTVTMTCAQSIELSVMRLLLCGYTSGHK